MKTISSLSLQLYPRICIYSCTAADRRKSSQSKRCPGGSSAPDAPQTPGVFAQVLYNIMAEGMFHSLPPCSPITAFPLFLLFFFQAAWFISSARSSSAQVLAVFTSSLHFPAHRTQLAWLTSVSFLPTLIPCKLNSKLFLELAVHLVCSRAVSELGKD